MSSSRSGGASRDRDKHRAYLSGASKRKAKEERAARKASVLSKMTNISQLFSPKCNTDHDNAQGEQLEDAANASSIIGVTSNNDDDYHETSTSTTHQDRSNLFCADLGMWPADVSEEMREYWTMKGSDDCQNLDAKLSESATKFEGEKYNRQCQKTLFTYTHQLTKQTISRNWLCYSPSEQHCTAFPAN